MAHAQSCPTLRDLIHCGPPGSSVQEIYKARIMEWVANPFSRGSSPPRDRTQISCIAGRFFTTEPPGKPYAYKLSSEYKYQVYINYQVNKYAHVCSVISDSLWPHGL